MRQIDQTYEDILAGEHTFEVKVNIAGTDYGQDVIFGATSDSKLFDSAPTIGGVYSGTFEFSMLGDGASIPKMAKVIPYFRAKAADGTLSSWIKCGEYYIDTRSVTHNDNGLAVFNAVCYDAMLKANADYATSSLVWPSIDASVVAEIASAIGVSQDSRNASVLTNNYSIQLPTKYTMRDVLSFIAAMYAANWIITDEGKLRIVPIGGGSDTLTVGKSCKNLELSPLRPVYTKLVYELDESTAVESGSAETNVLEVYNPMGTQAECDAAFAVLSAWQYQPFDASGVWDDPCVELGDQISVVGTSGTIYSRKITFGAGMSMDLSAPNDNYIDHEYEYKSPEDRRYERTVAGMSSEIAIAVDGVTILSQNKADKDSLISLINVSPEQITIDSNKISLAGKTIDLTSDVIQITSTNFSVDDTGLITATGVNLSGSFTMTDGSINITTSLSSDNVIQLNYSSGSNIYQHLFSPKQDSIYTATSSSADTINTTAYGLLIQHGATPQTMVSRMNLSYLGLDFYDANGDTTASYPYNGQEIFDSTDIIQGANLTSGTQTDVRSITLQPGKYILHGYVCFNANATGVRVISVSYTSGSYAPANGWNARQAALPSGWYTTCNVCMPVNLTTAKTLYLVAYQNSGSSLGMTDYELKAVKLL